MVALFSSIGAFILEYPIAILAVLFVINFVTMIMYAVDKKRAKKEKWRIPEARLLTFAFCFGALGALIGIYYFRHKTKHLKFTILVPLFFVLQIGFIAFSIVATML